MDYLHPYSYTGVQPGTLATSIAQDSASGTAWDEYSEGPERNNDAPGYNTHWRRSLAPWLATLNPGRTPREYEIAVHYFFEVPGVPQELAAISYDLLLAYRSALALRAAPRERRHSRPRANAASSPANPRLAATGTPLLSGNGGFTINADNAHQADSTRRPFAQTPLAPATVNIRLTALRQFLIYCVLRGSVTELTSDQIHLALRRLSIVRRKPYQILAEPEWKGFLAAAEAPKTQHTQTSPWGIPRALRQQQSAHATPASSPPTDAEQANQQVRSNSGLTGKRTAMRDHALIALALATGLRAIEISLLDLSDLSREYHGGKEEWWLVLPDAKTKGQRGGRTLPLPGELVETLFTYIHSTHRSWSSSADNATPLFLSTATHHRLTPTHISRIVDRVETQWLADRSSQGQKKVGREPRAISPHSLRHSTAVALLEGNPATGRPPATVEHVRGWLGHFDIRTTQGYLAHLDARRHRRKFALAREADTTVPSFAPQDDEDEP